MAVYNMKITTNNFWIIILIFQFINISNNFAQVCPKFNSNLSGWDFISGKYNQSGNDNGDTNILGLNRVYKSEINYWRIPGINKDYLFNYLTNKSDYDLLDPSIKIVRPGSNSSIKLGSDEKLDGTYPSNLAVITYKFKVDPLNPYYTYHYAVILNDPDDEKYHAPSVKSFFNVVFKDDNGNILNCGNNLYIPNVNTTNWKKNVTSPDLPTIPVLDEFGNQKLNKWGELLFDYRPGNAIFSKDWTTNVVDLSAYKDNDYITVTFAVTGCAARGHYGYAYLDAECFSNSFTVSPIPSKVGQELTFKYLGTESFSNQTYTWNFGDNGPVSNGVTVKHTYSQAKDYPVSLGIVVPNNNGSQCNLNFNKTITIIPTTTTPPPPCTNCIPSFSPIPGNKYLLSGWVKKKYTGVSPATFTEVGIHVFFKTTSGETVGVLYTPSGPIIDGWQRIEASFDIPIGATTIGLDLVNNDATMAAYFDDIRVHPFKSNMKSFVYDPHTQKLVAELDENNYATKYEYDDEGILIRVKKETERGVMTIKETRNNQSKVR